MFWPVSVLKAVGVFAEIIFFAMFFALRYLLRDVSSVSSTFAMLYASILLVFAGCLVSFCFFFVAHLSFCDPSRAVFVFFGFCLYSLWFLRDVSSKSSLFACFKRFLGVRAPRSFLMMSRAIRSKIGDFRFFLFVLLVIWDVWFFRDVSRGLLLLGRECC